MKFSIDYVKNDQHLCLLEKKIGVTNLQNYIPIYDLFFKMSESSSKIIQLNETYKLKDTEEKISNNQFIGGLYHVSSGKRSTKKVFFKYAPLFDPSKFLSGSYEGKQEDIFTLPSFNPQRTRLKSDSVYNSAYTDSFFSFLSSKLLHTHHVIHGIDYYGSFLCNQDVFEYNIRDDIDYLFDSSFFHENNKKLFHVDTSLFLSEEDDNISHPKKTKLQIQQSIKSTYEDKMNDEIFDGLFYTSLDESSLSSEEQLLEVMSLSIGGKSKIELNKTFSSSSTCSSRTSITTASHDDDDDAHNEDDPHNEENNDEDDNKSFSSSNYTSICSDDEESNDDEDEVINAYIPHFPVTLIALEMCDQTLDEYIQNTNPSEKEWGALLLQVIFTLIIYQHTFDFTHNDLHTNNIMCVSTSEAFIYYFYNKQYYKVPTYGKIWKIIDFGRAIYKFNGEIICSDCFSKDGDASGQYNCEPFFNESKPRIEPNKSFDLCRLGCCLLDYFVDDFECINVKQLDPIAKLIYTWCCDDNDKNVLYKKNGDERYPEFKLYKMISRIVHNHTPQKQLSSPIFKSFQTSQKPKSNKSVLDIDALPRYTEITKRD